MQKIHGITIQRKKISDFCKLHGIERLSLFGSVLRDDFEEGSDIDLLVEFQDGSIPGLIELSRYERELSMFFNGRKVDLRTPKDLSRYFRKDVISGSVVLFAAS